MLAQNFKTAADLLISDVEMTSLITVLGMLERGEIGAEDFDMSRIIDTTACGTVGCLLGWAYTVSKGAAFPAVQAYVNGNDFRRASIPLATQSLFRLDRPPYTSERITPPQAALALRNYLTTGEASWDEVLA